MDSLSFKCSPLLTLGVEIDLQILDARSLDLTDSAPRIFRALGGEQPHVKPEIFRSMLEINTSVCETVREVRDDLKRAVDEVHAAAPCSFGSPVQEVHPGRKVNVGQGPRGPRGRLQGAETSWIGSGVVPPGV